PSSPATPADTTTSPSPSPPSPRPSGAARPTRWRRRRGPVEPCRAAGSRPMAFRCPWGHQSTNDEYCDFCGALNPLVHPAARTSASRSAAGVAVVEQPCRVCGTGRDGDDRYCVNCGYDFEEGEPLPDQPIGGWKALSLEYPHLPSTIPGAGEPPAALEARGSAPALVLLVRLGSDRLD